MNLFTNLRQDWHATAPKDLLDAPVTALKAVDQARADALRDVLQVNTLRDMATHPVADWVWRTFRLFRAGLQRDLPQDANAHVTEEWRGRACGQWLASPLSSLADLSAEDVQRLGDDVGWLTVRQMASDAAFETAREVHRIVTGEPVPPEDASDKPLPDYFSGGTQRFMERKREAAGLPKRPPPPPPPPPRAPETQPETVQQAASQQAAPQAASAAGELPVEGDVPPAMAAAMQPQWASTLPAGPRRHHKDYTDAGTYIPKGGGSRGWVENQGVARNERANRYRYHEMVDIKRFRSAELEETVRVNNRGAERKDLRMQVRWNTEGAGPPTPGLCLNVSITGAMLRIGQALKEGTPVEVTWVYRDELLGNERPVLSLRAAAVWCKSVNPTYRTPRYDCGVHFDPLEIDAQERLTMLLTDRVEELLQAEPPAEAAEA